MTIKNQLKNEYFKNLQKIRNIQKKINEGTLEKEHLLIRNIEIEQLIFKI